MTKQNYFRVDTGKFAGVYEIKTVDSVTTKGKRVICPCCKKSLKPICDTIQWGFWEDLYTTYWVCPPCGKAIVFAYKVVCEVAEVKVNA